MQKQAESLLACGRYRDALSALGAESSHSTSEEVLRAYLRAQCEGPALVATQAASLLALNLAPIDKARCLEIVGRATGYGGDLRNGIRLLEEASRVVSADPRLTARIEYHLVKSLLNWVGVEPALARLPRLTKTARATGDGNATVDLHLVCAEIEMKRNDKAAADFHVDIATDLLRRFPNPAQEALLLQVRADEAGLSNVRAVMVSNIGYFLLQTGQLAKVPAYLNSQRALFGNSGTNAISEGSTEFELSLANDDMQRASELAESIAAISGRLEGGYSYYGLWYLLVRVQWLMRIGKSAEALRIAEDAVPFAKSMAADSLLVRLRLRAAEAAVRSTNIESGLKHLSEVLLAPNLSSASVGDIARIAAIVSASQPARSASLFARAARVFDHGGLLTSAAEVARNRREIGHVEAPEQDSASRLSTGLEIIEAWLTIADVLAHGELVGLELLAMIRDIGCAEAAALVRRTSGNATVIEALNWTDQEDTCRDRLMFVDVGADPNGGWQLMVVPKPDTTSRLTVIEINAFLHRLRRSQQAVAGDARLSSVVGDDSGIEIGGMVAGAEATKELIIITRRVATSNVTVLFTGETGTGKELFARALHESSGRRGRPFVPFNCSAVARDMLDSQLFGYRRGAFTGAHDAFPGVIRAAAGGTLFLDEIGELSLEMQPKLLRFLESGEIHPLGEPKPIMVDVRVVAATNAKLEELVAQGRFREDLFYRLNVVRLQVPPLRERREEIPLLVQHFLDKFSRESQKTGIRLADATMEYLILFKWPGNVRQLANEVRRMVALTESGAVLMPEHLSEEIAASRQTVPTARRPIAPTEFVVRVDQPISAAMEHVERSMIKYAMEIAGDRLEDAAQMLGLSRKGLYLKRQRLKMVDASLRPEDADQAAS